MIEILNQTRPFQIKLSYKKNRGGTINVLLALIVFMLGPHMRSYLEVS
jgi:hypothetical protein